MKVINKMFKEIAKKLKQQKTLPELWKEMRL